MSRDLSFGPAGFAELADGGTGAELLAEARERQTQARMRRVYLAPVDPTHPMAG